MNASPLLFVAISLASIALGWALFHLFDLRSELHKARQLDLDRRAEELLREQRQSQIRLIEATDRLRVELETTETHLRILAQTTTAFSDSLALLPTLIDGLKDMAKAQADQMDQFSKTVELLQASIGAPENQDQLERYATDSPAAMRATEQEEVNSLIRKGVSREEAQARVSERRLYESLGRDRK